MKKGFARILGLLLAALFGLLAIVSYLYNTLLISTHEDKIVETIDLNQTPVEEIPPDPGEAGKATVAGIDSDNDGVRDDVQRYIVLSVPESARHREALKQIARVIQRELLANSKEEAVRLAQEDHSIECLSYLGVRKPGRWREVQALMLNTKERLYANDVYNDRINGQVFVSLPDSEERSACKFNVEALPN